jgi:hypothetical protein
MTLLHLISLTKIHSFLSFKTISSKAQGKIIDSPVQAAYLFLKQEAGKVDHGLTWQWRLVLVSIIEKLQTTSSGCRH